MIVKLNADSIEVITHYAHGLQAGQIALQLKEELRPPYWLETLTAIIEHDDQQLNFERNNNITSLGLPADFSLIKSSEADILERCKRVMKQCRERSGWVTLLVSMHLEFIYADLFQESAAFRKFMDRIKEERKELRKVYAVNATDCKKYYEVLRFCDRLSLILLQDQVPSLERKIEINKSINKVRYFIHEKDNFYHVEPSPFTMDFTITTEVYQLKKIIFSTSDELQEHLLETMPVLKHYKFKN